jgi:PAS domain S-box-containing protein
MNDQRKTKQAIIQESNALEYSEGIINTVREPLIVLDKDLRVVTASRSFYEFFKVKPEETEGQLIYDLGNKQWDIPKLQELLETILPQKTTFDNYEVEHDFATIGKRIMLLNARQIKRALGKEHIILLAIEDVTERRLSEEKLLLATIVEFSKDAIVGKSLDGIITSWNKGAEEIYGYTKSEIMGKSISVLVPPQLPDEMTEMLSKIKLGEEIKNYETVRRRKDGQNIYVSLTVSAIHDPEGRIVGASTIARDITERKRLENLLRESEIQYRLLFETANDGIVLIEKNEGKIANINPSIEKMLGYSAKESIGNKLQDVGLIIDNGDFQITMKALNEKGLLRYNDVPVKTKSGKQIYTDTYLVDKAKFAQCNIRDITERKQSEDALKESEKKYRLLAENLHDVIFVLDMNLNYTYVSPSIKILWGYEPIEVVKQQAFETLTPSSIDLAVRALSEVMELEKSEHRDINISRTLPLETIRKDGTIVWTEVKFSFIRDENQQPVGILGVTRDITERRQAETILKQSEGKYRSIFENTQEGIFRTTPDGKIIMANQALSKMFGYESPEGFMADITDIGRQLYVNPEDRRKLKETVEKHGFIKGYEVQNYRKDGSIIWISLTMNATSDGKGQILYYDGINEDITNRKESAERMRKALGATAQAIAVTIEMRDPYTAGHQRRVADLASSIAKEMNFPDDQIFGIHMAATIHDLGKISVPSEILSKPTKLKKMEFDLIKEHSQSGYDILKDIDFPWPIARMVLEHHERMDGSGYPRNLKGDDILIEARIIAVADVVEAMASHRPYRPGLGIDAALAEIEKNKGTHYDNTVADACLKLFREKGYKLT